MVKVVGALAALALACLCGPAAGAPFLELVGAVDSTNPYSARALSAGSGAAYFNPALLADSAEQAGLFCFYFHQQLDIGLQDRPAGADVSAAVYDARLLNPDGTTSRLPFRPLATADLINKRGSHDPDSGELYLGFGMTKQLVPGRLALGFYALVPATRFQSQDSFFSDERQQFFSNSLHFELLEDRTRMSLLSLGLGGRIAEWLSVGAGVTVANDARVRSELYVGDATYQETAEINTSTGLEVRFVPHFGLAAQPVEGLNLAATVHMPYSSDVVGESDVQFWDYPYSEGEQSLTQKFEFGHAYEPLRASLSAAGRFAGITVAGSGTWTRWSKYRDRHGERPSAEWGDTVSGSVGIQAAAGRHSLGLDVRFEPSPVPDQTGRTNYVDNSRLGLAGGWELPFRLLSMGWKMGIQGQFHYLIGRSVDKAPGSPDPVFDEFPESVDVKSGLPIAAAEGLQTNNPGYPGFGSGGWMLGGGAWLKAQF